MNTETLKHMGLIVGGVFSGAYFLSHLVTGKLNQYLDNHSEQIKSYEHLENVMKEERNFLGIPDEVKVELVSKSVFDNSQIHKNSEKGNNYYEMFLNPRNFSRDSIRHEFTHLKKGHLDKTFSKNKNLNEFLGFFYYTFYAEPQTTLYCWKNRKKK